MALIFDTLLFTQRLRIAQISQEHAEAHADVMRDVILVNVASKDEFKAELAQIRSELKAFEEALINRIVRLVVTIMIGVVTVYGALVAMLTNFGKFFGK